MNQYAIYGILGGGILLALVIFVYRLVRMQKDATEKAVTEEARADATQGTLESAVEVQKESKDITEASEKAKRESDQDRYRWH